MIVNLKYKKRIEEFIPSYSIIPLIMVPIVNGCAYFGTRLFTGNLYHHSMKIFLDNYIELNTWFVYVYILAYIQWIIGFILIARQSKSYSYRFLFGEMIAKSLCMLCFLVYPTTIVRPEITGTGISDLLTGFIYSADAADNLFPSIHCLESYICLRSALGIRKLPGWYIVATAVFTALVFASTVFLKQHVVADMLGAVAAAEIGLFITGRIFNKKRELANE